MMSKGIAFLLKVQDGDNYSTVAGLRLTSMTISGEPVDASKGSDSWQKLTDDKAKRSIAISAGGIMLGSAAESVIRARAIGGSVDGYALSFEDGSKLTGQFMLTKLEYLGDLNGERNWLISMASSGPVVTP